MAGRIGNEIKLMLTGFLRFSLIPVCIGFAAIAQADTASAGRSALSSGQPALIEFGAETCSQCKRMKVVPDILLGGGHPAKLTLKLGGKTIHVVDTGKHHSHGDLIVLGVLLGIAARKSASKNKNFEIGKRRH